MSLISQSVRQQSDLVSLQSLIAFCCFNFAKMEQIFRMGKCFMTFLQINARKSGSLLKTRVKE